MTTVFAGRPAAFGAVRVSTVPFGWLTSVHFMSNAHSMVRPAITLLSAAIMSTAVQARSGPDGGEQGRRWRRELRNMEGPRLDAKPHLRRSLKLPHYSHD